MEFIIRSRNYILSITYRFFLKPLFFLVDPEKVHKMMLIFGSWLGEYSIGRNFIHVLFYYSNQKLGQTIKGLYFSNPVGLAAGYDKDGRLTQIIPEVSFGFAEIGSITGQFCMGNSGRHLWRLEKSQSIIVNYGLKNFGADVISGVLSELSFRIPIGISIAKTNRATTIDEKAGIADYVHAYTAFVSKNVGDYYTINVSCPNARGGQSFLEPHALSRLLEAISKVRLKYGDTKPWFLKLAADLYPVAIDSIIEVAREYHVTGFICTNLSKNRHNKKILEKNIPISGGLSGAVIRELSDNLIRYIYRRTGREFIIIGCGGIFSAEDAYKKIKAGASLVQLITGMIFKGPQLISAINQGLVALLENDGYTSITQAIGADYEDISLK